MGGGGESLFNKTSMFKKKKDRQVLVNISEVLQYKTSARPRGCC